VALYPGSPALAAGVLRKADRYIGCELRPDDHALLVQTLSRHPNAQALLADGYRTAAEQAGRLLVLIDPPFERPDDYEQSAKTMAAVLRRNRAACVAVWLPLKDLETFDAFLRRIEEVSPTALVAETRLRPLTDPMKMNGCALVIAGPPPGLAAPLADICGWVAGGGAGGTGRVWRLGL
jgi:23S rRNA (adenine2030-N6)-methyltransferase